MPRVINHSSSLPWRCSGFYVTWSPQVKIRCVAGTFWLS